MGFLITLLLSVIFGVLGIVRPKLAMYLIIALFIFFDEQGPGFTTFRGSFPFNAYFVHFFGVRLIEVLTISAYIPILVMSRERALAAMPFRAERLIVMLFFIWIAVLVAVEFGLVGKPSYSDWRLVVSGAMQFHMLILLFREEEEVEQLVRIVLIMLATKAAYGLVMYAAGHGTLSPRGKLPFFWDTKQIEAFGLGLVLLTGYLLNFSSMNRRHRSIPFWWAVVMWIVLAAAVGGSIRRTVWVTTFLGMGCMLVLSRRTNILHYFAVVMVGAVTVAGILLAPGLDNFRDHMGKYVKSMNLFDERERTRNIENDVHINNVEQYFKMITEKSDIMALGMHGPSGVHYYEILIGAYSEGGYRLGMAHNGILRTVLFWGIPGMLLYIAFYVFSIFRTLNVHRKASDDHWLKHVAVGAGVVLTLDFASALVFSPPFYTASKGLFYTFLEVFIVGIVAYRLVQRTQVKRAPAGAGAWCEPASAAT